MVMDKGLEYSGEWIGLYVDCMLHCWADYRWQEYVERLDEGVR